MTPEQPAPPDLRPLGVGETLDAAFRMLRQSFGTYLKIGVLFVTVPVILTGLYMNSEILFVSEQILFVEDPDAFAAATLLLGLLTRLAELLCFGVLVHFSTRVYMNYSETAGSIIRASGRRFLPFFGMTVLLVLYAFAVLIGAGIASLPFGPLGGVVVAVIFVMWATFYSLSAPAFWYEEARASKAIGRSSTLVRRRFWSVLGSLAVGIVIIIVFTFGLGALAVGALFNIETALPYILTTLGFEYIGNLLGLAVLAPIVTVVYFDGRVRNEGFDMTLKLGEAKNDEPPPAVPW